MRKFYFFLLLSLMAYLGSFAQESGHFPSIRTLNLTTWRGSGELSRFQSRNYLLLQSKKELSLKDKQSLQEQGVMIFTHPATKLYTASVAATLSRKQIKAIGFESVYYIPLSFKIDRRLHQPQENAPWCMLGKNLRVQITFIPGLSPNIYLSDLVLSGALFEGGNRWQVSASILYNLAGKPYILRVEPVTPELSYNNLPGKTLHGSSWMEQPFNGSLTGKGVKVGEWDGGYVGQHIDFGADNITIDSMVYSDHATHVAGTIKSKGILNPYARGMAPDALLWSSDFYGDIQAEMDTLIGKEHIHITSNSYGYSPAYDPCGTKGAYDMEAQRTDSVAYKYPYLSHVFAAGNSQTQCSGGYRTIGSGFNSAKNVLTVGAVDYRGNMSSFSSWGPVLDGRLKPEICGVGVNVYSTLNKDTYAGGYNGTSMATPGVSGTLAQLYEKYYNTYHTDPEASLFRAILCNTANDAGNVGPDFKFGFGILNGQSALTTLDSVRWITDTISQGNIQSYSLTCPAGLTQLKVTAAWTDIPGDPQQSNSLVQDLDIYLLSPVGDTIRPWVLNPSVPAALAIRSKDTLNNIEQITVDATLSGTWQLVTEGRNLPGGTQTFALTWTLDAPQLKVTYPAGGEFLNAGETATLRWNAVGAVKPYSLFYSLDSGQTWVTISTNVNTNFFDWTVPNVSSNKVYIKVSNGVLTDSSENVFTIYNSVSGLTATSCSNAIKLAWNAVGSASKYYIYKLDFNNYSWRLVDSTIATKRTWVDYTVANGKKYYYTISPLGLSGALGRKCFAVSAVPGVNPSNLISNVGGTTLLCGDTITLGSVSGLSYLWSNGLTTRSIQVMKAGNYNVATTLDSGCIAYSSVIQIRNGFNTSVLKDTVCMGDSVILTASSPQLHTARFTEIIQNKSGTGAVSSYPSWIGGSSVNADYAEISNLGDDTMDLSVLTFEQWNSGGIMSQFTWPSGSLCAPGQLSILHIGNTATNDPSKLFFNTGATDNQSASGDPRGYILRHTDGTIYDVVAVNGFTFPANAEVGVFDWEPATSMPSMQGTAGVGLSVADYNRSQEWYIASSGSPLTTGTYNTNLKKIPSGSISWNYKNNSASGTLVKYIQDADSIRWTGALNTLSCQASDTGKTFAYAPGAIQILSTGHDVCPGETIFLRTSHTGNYTYQWNATAGGNITLNADTAIEAKPVANSIYELIQTDQDFGCVYKAAYNINVYDRTTPTWNFNTKKICMGDSILISGQSDETRGWNKWEMEIQFNAAGTTLSGSSKVYIHSGLTDTAAVGSSWRQIRGNWGNDDGLGQMDSIGVDVWRIRLNLPSYFGVNSDSTLGAVSMIFRNADGSIISNHNGDSIYISLNGSSINSSWNAVQAQYIHAYQIIHQGAVLSNSNQLYVADSGAFYLTDASFHCAADTSAALQIQWFPASQRGSLSVSRDSICVGDSIQLIQSGHTGNSSWEYYNGQQWNTLSLQGDTVWYTPNVSGMVRALATDSCHAIYSDSVSIILLPPPVSGNIVLNQDSICAGDTVSFSYSSSVNNLQWSFMGVPVSGPGWKPQSSGYLNMVVDGGKCASILDSAFINVFGVPQLSKLSASQAAFCEGDSVMLSLDSFSNATLHWQYFDSVSNNQFVTFKSLDSLYIYTSGFDTLTFGGATFRVEGISAFCGKVYSDTVRVMIYPKNRPGTLNSSSDSICPGYFLQVVYTPAGSAKWFNQHVSDWQLLDQNGQWVSTGSVADTLQYQVNYNTSVRAVFISGCDTQYIQKSITLKTHAVAGTISASKDTSCIGDSVTFTSAGHQGMVTWQWNTGAGYTDLGSGNPFTASITQAGQMRARYTQGTCDTLYSNILNVYTYPQPQAGQLRLNKNNVCPGSIVTLYQDNYLGSSIWQEFDSINMNWVAVGTGDSLMIQPKVTALYRSAVTRGTCGPVYSNTIQITVTDGPVHGPLVADRNKVCVGSSVQLSAGNNALGNFIWQEYIKATATWKNLSGTGNTENVYPYDSSLYRAIISKNGCVDTTNTLWITTLPTPNAGISAGGNTTICEGETVTLNATTGVGYRYQWQLDTNNISGAVLANYNTGNAGKYRVIVSLANGCSDTSGAIQVTVNPTPPTPLITRTGMMLDAGLSGYNYQWYNNTIPLAGETGQTFLITKAGSYTVKISNAFGCFVVSAPYVNTGVTSAESLNTIDLYPNPGTGLYHLTEKVQQVKVYDMAGRMLPVGLNVDGRTLDLSNYAPGIYQVMLIDGIQTYTVKVVKYGR